MADRREERAGGYKEERTAVQQHVEANTTVVDRLAVCRMDESGFEATATSSPLGQATEPTPVASFTATLTASHARPSTAFCEFLRQFTSPKRPWGATTCPEWRRRLT